MVIKPDLYEDTFGMNIYKVQSADEIIPTDLKCIVIGPDLRKTITVKTSNPKTRIKFVRADRCLQCMNNSRCFACINRVSKRGCTKCSGFGYVYESLCEVCDNGIVKRTVYLDLDYRKKFNVFTGLADYSPLYDYSGDVVIKIENLKIRHG